jgi:probable rRNA maturation factor
MKSQQNRLQLQLQLQVERTARGKRRKTKKRKETMDKKREWEVQVTVRPLRQELLKRTGIPLIPRIQRSLKKILSDLDCSHLPTAVSELSILITDNVEIQTLNRDFRNKDRPTDVLSFSLLEGEESLPGEISLGDIAISLEVCEEQAVRESVSCDEELFRLLVHGCLHLFGYDHENVTPEAAQEMFDLQDSLINSLYDTVHPLFQPTSSS